MSLSEVHGPTSLTPAEHEVIRGMIRLGRQQAVAHELGRSLQNVKNHMSHIIAKLDAENGLQAAVLYDRWQRDGGQQTWPDVDRRASTDRRHHERRQGERRATPLRTHSTRQAGRDLQG